MILFLFLSFIFTDEFYTNEFMELGVGARALGMGNAFVGLADDPTAFYWNPAGLARIKSRELFLMHSEDFDTLVKTNTAAFIYPSVPYTIGVAIYWVEVPSIPISDSTEFGYEVIEWVNASDYVAYLSYARPFKPVDVGVNIKAIFRDWGITTAYGVETDCGLLSTFKGIKLGINFVNLIGSGIYWQDTIKINTQLPLLVKLGGAIQEQLSIGKINICMSFDTSPQKRIAQFTTLYMDTYIGTEYWWQDKFAIRVGWDKGLFSGGCGIIYKKLNLDYGIKFHPHLGLLKRLSGYITF